LTLNIITINFSASRHIEFQTVSNSFRQINHSPWSAGANQSHIVWRTNVLGCLDITESCHLQETCSSAFIVYLSFHVNHSSLQPYSFFLQSKQKIVRRFMRKCTSTWNIILEYCLNVLIYYCKNCVRYLLFYLNMATKREVEIWVILELCNISKRFSLCCVCNWLALLQAWLVSPASCYWLYITLDSCS